MELENVRIPVRSHRQAMDWSLVLLSQGIEPIVERHPDDSSWGLLVKPEDYSRAVETLRLYRLENRHWPWQQEVLHPGVLFDWASVGWGLLVILFFWLSEGPADLRAAGMMDRVAASHGQWWRLFTAIWLHADISHLASNTGMGVLLLGLVMGRYGTATGLLAAYLAGAGGNVMVWLLAPGPHQSLGASGMVMGALGLLAIQSAQLWRGNPRARKFIVSAFLAGIALFLFLGTSPGTDVLAHAGGFVSGLVLGLFLARAGPSPQRGPTNFLSALGMFMLVLLPWWLALTK